MTNRSATVEAPCERMLRNMKILLTRPLARAGGEFCWLFLVERRSIGSGEGKRKRAGRPRPSETVGSSRASAEKGRIIDDDRRRGVRLHEAHCYGEKPPQAIEQPIAQARPCRSLGAAGSAMPRAGRAQLGGARPVASARAPVPCRSSGAAVCTHSGLTMKSNATAIATKGNAPSKACAERCRGLRVFVTFTFRSNSGAASLARIPASAHCRLGSVLSAQPVENVGRGHGPSKFASLCSVAPHRGRGEARRSPRAA